MVPKDGATWGRMICTGPTDAGCPVMGCSAGDAEHMDTKQGHREVRLKSEATSHDCGQAPSLSTSASPLFHSYSNGSIEVPSISDFSLARHQLLS